MDNPEMIDLFESEIDSLIAKTHGGGLSFWWILKIILTRIANLVMQADAEYYIKGGK